MQDGLLRLEDRVLGYTVAERARRSGLGDGPSRKRSWRRVRCVGVLTDLSSAVLEVVRYIGAQHQDYLDTTIDVGIHLGAQTRVIIRKPWTAKVRQPDRLL